MIKCQYCGYENSDNLDYCMNCSKILPVLEASDNLEDTANMRLNDLYNLSVEDINSTNNNLNNARHNFILNDDRDVFISTFISMVIPGSGLIYLKRQKLGFVILASTIILWSLSQFLYFIAKISMVNITLSLSIILYLFNVAYTFKLAEDISLENVNR